MTTRQRQPHWLAVQQRVRANDHRFQYAMNELDAALHHSDLARLEASGTTATTYLQDGRLAELRADWLQDHDRPVDAAVALDDATALYGRLNDQSERAAQVAQEAFELQPTATRASAAGWRRYQLEWERSGAPGSAEATASARRLRQQLETVTNFIAEADEETAVEIVRLAGALEALITSQDPEALPSGVGQYVPWLFCSAILATDSWMVNADLTWAIGRLADTPTLAAALAEHAYHLAPNQSQVVEAYIANGLLDKAQIDDLLVEHERVDQSDGSKWRKTIELVTALGSDDHSDLGLLLGQPMLDDGWARYYRLLATVVAVGVDEATELAQHMVRELSPRTEQLHRAFAFATLGLADRARQSLDDVDVDRPGAGASSRRQLAIVQAAIEPAGDLVEAAAEGLSHCLDRFDINLFEHAEVQWIHAVRRLSDAPPDYTELIQRRRDEVEADLSVAERWLPTDHPLVPFASFWRALTDGSSLTDIQRTGAALRDSRQPRPLDRACEIAVDQALIQARRRWLQRCLGRVASGTVSVAADSTMLRQTDPPEDRLLAALLQSSSAEPSEIIAGIEIDTKLEQLVVERFRGLASSSLVAPTHIWKTREHLTARADDGAGWKQLIEPLLTTTTELLEGVLGWSSPQAVETRYSPLRILLDQDLAPTDPGEWVLFEEDIPALREEIELETGLPMQPVNGTSLGSGYRGLVRILYGDAVLRDASFDRRTESTDSEIREQLRSVLFEHRGRFATVAQIAERMRRAEPDRWADGTSAGAVIEELDRFRRSLLLSSLDLDGTPEQVSAEKPVGVDP